MAAFHNGVSHPCGTSDHEAFGMGSYLFIDNINFSSDSFYDFSIRD